MKTTSKVVSAVATVLIFSASLALAGEVDGFPSKTVPETLSPVWLPIVVVGMFAVSYFRGRKRE